MKSTIAISQTDFNKLSRHFWRSELEERAAVLGVGVSKTPTQLRLLVRHVLLAPDEFFFSTASGHHLDSKFIANACLQFSDEALGYVSVHSHPLGDGRVGLSRADFRSNRLSFPITRDLVNGKPVASLVLSRGAAAGEVWQADERPLALDRLRVIGSRITDLVPSPTKVSADIDERFHRQVLLFGSGGQAILRNCRVGVVGLGGGGSAIVQQLVHLGVGTIVGVDDDTIKRTNLNRNVGSRPSDAKRRRKKGETLDRLARLTDPSVEFVYVDGDVGKRSVAAQLLDCDFIFCATDNLLSRNVVNHLCYQFLIPGVQIGAKIETSRSGEIEQIHGNVRTISPEIGCLSCHRVINPAVLAKELLSPEERRAQEYTNDPEVIDPSVITLNSGVASMAVTDFQMLFTSLFPEVTNLGHRMWLPLTREWLEVRDNRREGCRVCSRQKHSCYARGDNWDLMPVRA